MPAVISLESTSLNPEKMTVKQLRKASNDRKLLRQGDRSKKPELQKVLKTWIYVNRKSTTVEDGTQSSKVRVVSIRKKPSIKPTANVFSSSENNQICVAEITGEIHLMTMVTDGLCHCRHHSFCECWRQQFVWSSLQNLTVLNSMSLRQLMLWVCS